MAPCIARMSDTPLLPAEWHPQHAVILSWPHARGDFRNRLDAAHDQFLRTAAAIAPATPLIVIAPEDDTRIAADLVASGVTSERFRLVTLPTNDIWARDFGPITVFRNGAAVHKDFSFNGWGAKYASAADDAVTRGLAQAGLLPGTVETETAVLEGGSIESDGAGTILTTTRCLLAASRAGGQARSRAQAEDLLARTLGAKRVLWLAHGDLIGDDTDGHIDTLARFCDPGTIAYQAVGEGEDPQTQELKAMEAELQALRDAHGRAYRLIPLPMPAAIHAGDGRRLPAGYANFLITNRRVVVPTYNDAQDAVALDRLRAAFPAHEVVGVDCRLLITQNGSLHCTTMQIPLMP